MDNEQKFWLGFWSILFSFFLLFTLIVAISTYSSSYDAYRNGQAGTDQYGRPYCYGPACETCK